MMVDKAVKMGQRGFASIGGKPIVPDMSLPFVISQRAWPRVVAGLVLMTLAWAVPGHLASISPALLTRAGRDTPGLVQLGRARLEDGLPGPAALMLAGARLTGASDGAGLEKALAEFAAREPDLMPWGGPDPFLEPLRRQPSAVEARRVAESRPVLDFLVTEKAREALRGFLSNSKLASVRDTLALRSLTATGLFVPANQAGGQTLEALLLLAGLLQQGEHLNPVFAREWRDAVRAAEVSRSLGTLEPMLIDLLALGRRLDWRQLTEIAGGVESRVGWATLGRVARGGGDAFAVVLAASLAEGSTERVVGFRAAHPSGADDDLRQALASGQGALHLLIERGVPINRQPAAPVPGALAGLALLYPNAALAVKLALFAAGVFLAVGGRLFRLVAVGTGDADASEPPNGRASLVALAATVMFLAATEPYNRAPVAPPAGVLRLAVPVLGGAPDTGSLRHVPPTFSINMNTLISIGFFATLQLCMYWICLTKIREIAAADLPALVKLRLMENEENLFDGGLYIGIGGTATALVLQVLGLIEPNLLAAYSSNLFGITCVALVKIRLVRPYKTKLILSAQDAIAGLSGPVKGR
jgi:hypothetical protein